MCWNGDTKTGKEGCSSCSTVLQTANVERASAAAPTTTLSAFHLYAAILNERSCHFYSGHREQKSQV